MKTCRTCSLSQEFTNFYVKKSNKDGYDGRCKSCSKISDSKKYQQNKDAIKEATKEYRENTSRKPLSQQARLRANTDRRAYGKTISGKAIINASVSKRRAAKLERTPKMANRF